MRNKSVAMVSVVIASFAGVMAAWTVAAQQLANPRQQPGAMITMYAPEQHDLYDGHYVLAANRIHMVGGLNDPVGWDHMDNDARTVTLVSGEELNAKAVVSNADPRRTLLGMVDPVHLAPGFLLRMRNYRPDPANILGQHLGSC